MSFTFKLFCESIYSDGGELRLTHQNERSSSDDETISTFIGKRLYKTHLRPSGIEVLSFFTYHSSDESVALLKSLKGNGPYQVSADQVDKFLNKTAFAAFRLMHHLEPDVIIHPKSSSQLLTIFTDHLQKIFPRAELVHDAFIKHTPADVDELLNTDHPDWDKFETKHPDQAEKLRSYLEKNLDAGVIELKKLYKPYVKFIRNFIKLRSAYDLIDKVTDNNVLLVDDVLSSGTTFQEMYRQLSELEPKSIKGLTLFKKDNL